MYSFSPRSIGELNTCHPRLRMLFNEVIKHYDCSALKGFRDEQEQRMAFASKRSKVDWPNSKHNLIPSVAADVVPYPVVWTGEEAVRKFYHFAGYVQATAERMGVRVRWGGNWDGDKYDFADQNFYDLPHWELLPEEYENGNDKENPE